jgi:hypothetical protein
MKWLSRALERYRNQRRFDKYYISDIIPVYNLIRLKAENETSMPPARLREPGKV